MASELAEQGAGAGEPSRWRVLAGMAVWFGSMAAGMWLLHGWIERRSGLPADLALMVASLPGNLLGLLVVWKLIRTEPGVETEKSRRASETSRRRVRAWVIVTLCLLLVSQSGRVMLAVDGGVGEDWGWFLFVASFIGTASTDFLPSRGGLPPGKVEADQSERCEALRVSFLVLMVLGVLAAGAAVRWPAIGTQVWPGVLLAGALAGEIRMATLPRRALPQLA